MTGARTDQPGCEMKSYSDFTHRMQENLPTFLLLTLILKSWNVILQLRVMEMKPGGPNGSWSAWNFSQKVIHLEGVNRRWMINPFNESHFLFAVLRKKPSKKLTSRKFYRWADGIKLEKTFSLILWLWSKAKRKKKALYDFLPLKKRFRQSAVFLSLLGIKPRWKSCPKNFMRAGFPSRVDNTDHLSG